MSDLSGGRVNPNKFKQLWSEYSAEHAADERRYEEARERRMRKNHPKTYNHASIVEDRRPEMTRCPLEADGRQWFGVSKGQYMSMKPPKGMDAKEKKRYNRIKGQTLIVNSGKTYCAEQPYRRPESQTSSLEDLAKSLKTLNELLGAGLDRGEANLLRGNRPDSYKTQEALQNSKVRMSGYGAAFSTTPEKGCEPEGGWSETEYGTPSKYKKAMDVPPTKKELARGRFIRQWPYQVKGDQSNKMYCQTSDSIDRMRTREPERYKEYYHGKRDLEEMPAGETTGKPEKVSDAKIYNDSAFCAQRTQSTSCEDTTEAIMPLGGKKVPQSVCRWIPKQRQCLPRYDNIIREDGQWKKNDFSAWFQRFAKEERKHAKLKPAVPLNERETRFGHADPLYTDLTLSRTAIRNPPTSK